MKKANKNVSQLETAVRQSFLIHFMNPELMICLAYFLSLQNKKTTKNTVRVTKVLRLDSNICNLFTVSKDLSSVLL